MLLAAKEVAHYVLNLNATDGNQFKKLNAMISSVHPHAQGGSRKALEQKEVIMFATKDSEDVIVILSLLEAQQILVIDLDEDKELALQFIKENMARRVDKYLNPS